jgi:hypothetical protein
MLGARQGILMDFTHFPDDKLREEIEAMQLALSVPQSSDSEDRLRQKIDAARRELEKRDANRA